MTVRSSKERDYQAMNSDRIICNTAGGFPPPDLKRNVPQGRGWRPPIDSPLQHNGALNTHESREAGNTSV